MNSNELYKQMRNAGRDEAIRLGVAGNDAVAIAERAARAEQLAAECDRRYRQASGLIDPEPETFALGIIRRAAGDLALIAVDADLSGEVARSMDAVGGEEFVHDEDGDRWESWEPTAEVVAEAHEEHARIVADLLAETAGNV